MLTIHKSSAVLQQQLPLFIMLDYQPSMNKHKKRFKMWEQKIAQRTMPAKEQGNKLLFSIHLWNKVVRKYGSQKN